MGWSIVVLAVLGFVVILAVVGLGYLALIKDRAFRLHFSLRSIKVEIDPPEEKRELNTSDSSSETRPSTGS